MPLEHVEEHRHHHIDNEQQGGDPCNNDPPKLLFSRSADADSGMKSFDQPADPLHWDPPFSYGDR